MIADGGARFGKSDPMFGYCLCFLYLANAPLSTSAIDRPQASLSALATGHTLGRLITLRTFTNTAAIVLARRILAN